MCVNGSPISGSPFSAFPRTLNGIDGATELCQYAIPGGIGNPTATGGNQAVKDVSSLGQILEGTDLVGPHQAAVSLDVGCKNRDQPAFGIACFGQDAPSNRRLAYSAPGGEDISKFGFFALFLGK